MQSSLKIFSLANPKPQIVNFHYDVKRGCTVHYTINGRDEYLIANDRQLASALEDTNMIDTWEDNQPLIYVTYAYEVEGVNCFTAEPLNRFVNNWNRNKWQEFITAYEALKLKSNNRKIV